MKSQDLLDLMGEIDAHLIEDAAETAGGSLLPKRIARYGAVAAAVGIVCFSTYAIYGVVRDGIRQEQQPQSGHTDSAGTDTGFSPQESDTHTDTVPATTKNTLPTDLYVIETCGSTTVTTTVTTEYTLPVPADMEMPDASLEQEIGDRFRPSNDLFARSGALAFTVQKAECFDTLEEAGLTEDDLCLLFRKDCCVSHGSISNGDEQLNDASIHLTFDDRYKYSYIKAHSDAYRFITLDVRIENVNALSNLPDFYNDCRMPLNPFDHLEIDRWFDAFMDPCFTDANFARDYDFNSSNMIFSIHTANERTAPSINMPPAYFSLSGQAYDRDDAFRSDWFYLEPGCAVDCRIGAFMPKTLTTDMMFGDYQSETEWGEEYPAIGDDLKDYYFFGSGGISRPHVDLHFDEN